MIIRNTFIFGLIAAGIFSCSEKSEPEEQDEIEVMTESDPEDEIELEEVLEVKKAPKIKSFTAKSKFIIITQSAGLNENTGTDNIDIFLRCDYFDLPIKLTRDLGYSEVSLGINGVPTNAVFAFSTWFAGGGELIYGQVKDGVLQIHRKFEDEGGEEQDFELIREIDPNVPTDKPAYYIHYSSDENNSKELMIACSDDGKGMYAKYADQSRHVALEFLKDESEGSNTIEYFNEVVNDEIIGTYKMTHSGNWDYVEYTNQKSGKKYSFTINHDTSIVGDTYRRTPSL